MAPILPRGQGHRQAPPERRRVGGPGLAAGTLLVGAPFVTTLPV
jgi:hypothetical protein